MDDVDGTKFVGDIDPTILQSSCPEWLQRTRRPRNLFEMNVFIRTASKLHISAIIYRSPIGRSVLFNPAVHGPKKAYISVRVGNKVEKFKACSFDKFKGRDHLYNTTNLPRKSKIYISVPKGFFYVSGLVDKTLLQWITNKCRIH